MSDRMKRKDSRRYAGPRSGSFGRISAPILVIPLLLVAAVLATAAFALSGGSDNSGQKTAVIVDQLSLTQPNPEFNSKARRLLDEAGYEIDYFPGEEVTVGLYRSLPQRGYDLVILRTHAGITTEVSIDSGQREQTEYVSLFTGEPYTEGKYGEEELNLLGRARYDEDSEPLFGIGPAFIEQSMVGDFDGAIVVMMGCDGLRSQRTAEAFLNRGASSFVSWSKPVSASHTDAATERLLQLLLLEGLEAAEAVEQTAAELGPDPWYDGELRLLEG